MTNQEFSNEFDVLYNSIMSNAAAGLDEYEKSVFLTKAQDEIVKAYFNPKQNKTLEGFDGNERRQIDFSMIMRSVTYKPINFTIGTPTTKQPTPSSITSLNILNALITNQEGILTQEQLDAVDKTSISITNKLTAYTASPFIDAFFDYRDNSKAVTLESDIMMFVNEYALVTRNSNKIRLTVVPIDYNEYSRLMSKPFKRPLQYQAWRILDNSMSTDTSISTTAQEGVKRAELVIGPNDSIIQYSIRYVRRPRAIRLINFTESGLSIDGISTEQSCELDPILHQEILQRAVELAKAAYAGDLTSTVALGQTSETEKGIVTSSK